MSSAIDENVVKPPQKPVIRKTFIDDEMRLPLSANPKNIPIRKLPIIFTANVPHGNTDAHTTWHSLPVRNLMHVPRNPPRPAISIAFIIT